MRSIIVSAAAVLLAPPAFAQDLPATQSEEPATADPEMPAMPADMDQDSPGMAMAMEIVVTATRTRSRFASPSSGAVLSGDELALRVRSTLGDTLAHLPGVSSTSFGPSASRPVLRGFQGERTRLLIDAISSLDVSNTSPDHAVAINPLIAERIEILRAPDALRYGSGIIGGVVNTITSRIPSHAPLDGVDGKAEAGFGSAAGEYTLGATATVAATDHVVLHLDGHYLSEDDVAIGGFVLSRPQRAAALAASDASVRALAGRRGTLPNTSAQTWEIGGGASYLFDGGYVGISANHFDSYYGLPTRSSLDPTTPVPNSSIDLGQNRVDGVLQLDLAGPVVEAVKARLGWADYKHDEIDTDAGQITATFVNHAIEGRAEADFARQGRWKGSIGIQGYSRDFRVAGASPLLPPNATVQIALFSQQKLDFGPIDVEGAVRYEHTDISARAIAPLDNLAVSRRFDAYSVSGSASYRVTSQINLSSTAFYAERAPVVEELFTQGADPGTQGVLLGNPALSKERSWGIEGVARAFGRQYSLEASIFYDHFPSYIYSVETGAFVGGLPVFQFFENRADYYGFEVQGKLDVTRLGSWKFGIDALVDGTWATLLGDGPAPRIPPLRVLGGIEARSDRLTARVESEWVTQQRRVTPFETPTDGYVMVNISMTIRPFARDSKTSLLIAANNLGNVDARRNASFLKDFAPIAGRDIRLTLHTSF